MRYQFAAYAPISLSASWTLKSIHFIGFQIEVLDFVLVLQHLDGSLTNSMWNDYVKLLLNILSYLREMD